METASGCETLLQTAVAECSEIQQNIWSTGSDRYVTVATGWPLGETIFLIYRPFSKRALTELTDASVIGPLTERATLNGPRSKEVKAV